MTQYLVSILSLSILVFASSAFGGPLKKTPAELDAKILQAHARLDALQSNPKNAIPPVIMRSARGIIILRKLKAGLGIGAEAGGGVALVKGPDGVWSAPAFVGAADASWGLQLGAQDEDIVMLLMTEEGLRMLKEGKKGNLGVEMKASLGPVDIGKDFDTASLSPVLIYKNRTGGGFAGVSVKGGGIVGAKNKNMTYYGNTIQWVLFSGEAPVSENAENLINAIYRFSGR